MSKKQEDFEKHLEPQTTEELTPEDLESQRKQALQNGAQYTGNRNKKSFSYNDEVELGKEVTPEELIGRLGDHNQQIIKDRWMPHLQETLKHKNNDVHLTYKQIAADNDIPASHAARAAAIYANENPQTLQLHEHGIKYTPQK